MASRRGEEGAVRDRSTDQKILDEAKDRFRRAQEWESEWRSLAIKDTKFNYGDSDNGWQWPDNLLDARRDANNRPALTVNKTQTIINKIVNEAKENPPEPRIKPVGDKVSFEAAEVWQGLMRHIVYVSNGQSIFGKGKEDQLTAGLGYWHITHDFEHDRSFNQEIKISPLDWVNAYLDCDIKTVDGADAMWGFLFTEYDRKEFERLYPDVSLPPARSPGIDDKDDWIRKDAVRLAEYYRIVLTQDELIFIEDGQGHAWTGLKSEIPAPWAKQLKDYAEGKTGGDYRHRDVNVRQLEWYKIGGNEILEKRTDLKGKYVPIIRLPGRERRIEGKLYRAGMVRALKDPQRIYNYNTSGEVEVVALQTKSPWVIAAAAIEGNETAWQNANTANAAYLTYRHTDEDGNPIPPPERKDPPTASQGFLEGLRISAAEMEMVSGIQQAQQINPSLERTPKAIDERMRAGEVTNYDFTDNEMQAIRHTAVVIMDLAPHIYDTKRVVKIRAKDGTISEVHIDPDSEEAYRKEEPEGDEKAIKVLFNPSIGKYAVEADVGPAYATQRQEAWHAFVEIIKGDPELTKMIGDLGFLAADFPMAQEIADRLRRNIEQTAPWLLKDSQTGPLIQKLTQDLQNAQSQVAELMEKLTEERIKSQGKAEARNIDAYDADTRRLTAISNAVPELGEPPLHGAIKKVLSDMLGFDLDQIVKTNREKIAGASGSGEISQSERSEQ